MAEAKETVSEVICNACGKTNPGAMRFCGFCGAPLTVTPRQPRTPDPPKGPTTVENSTPTVTQTAPASKSPDITATSAEPRASMPPQQLMREREKLISQATAYRVKGQITDARVTLQKAIELTTGMSPRDIAPLEEQIGDLLLIEEMHQEALAAYSRARELDPKRVSAEKKYAEAALQIAQATGKLSINEALLRGDSVADLIASGELGGNRGKRNAGVAMILSTIVPGFGQFYNGQIVKALVLVGAFAIALLVLSMSPEKDNLFKDIAAIFAMQGGKASFALSPLISFFAIVLVGTWLYAIVDAPFNAGKSGDNGSDKTVVDKSGWEV